MSIPDKDKDGFGGLKPRVLLVLGAISIAVSLIWSSVNLFSIGLIFLFISIFCYKIERLENKNVKFIIPLLVLISLFGFVIMLHNDSGIQMDAHPSIETHPPIETPTSTPTSSGSTDESTIKITYPLNSSLVNMQETITGTAENIPEGQKLWILVYPLSANKIYPQTPNVNIINGEWSKTIGIGAKDNAGETFKIIAVLADQEATGEFTSYINTGMSTGSWPGMDSIPDGAKVVNEVTVTRRGNSPSVEINSPTNRGIAT